MGLKGLKLMVLIVCMGFFEANMGSEMILETADALNLAV